MAGNQVQLNVTADATSAISEFDRTIRAADKMSRALSLVGKEGADDAAILQQVGEQGGEAFQQIIQRGEAAGRTAKQIAAELKTLAAIQKNRALDDKADAQAAQAAADQRIKAEQAVSRAASEGAADLKAQSDALQGVARQALGLASALVQTSSAFEQQRAKLTGLYHDTDTARAKFGEFVEFASKTPFEVRSVVDAAIQLQALGQDASAILPIAGDLAARFGRDIPDAAQALGKALSGSQDGVQVLIDSFGVSRQQLKQYGATVDETGSVILRGETNLAKFRAAVMAIAKTEWAGSMALQADTLQGKLSNLSDATEQLQAKMGDGLAPAVRDGATAITGILERVTKSYPEWLEFGGRIVGVTAGVTAMVAGVGAATVALPLLAAAFGPLTLAAIAATAGIAELNQVLHENIDANRELDLSYKSSSDRLQLLAKAHREWADSSADSLHRMGVTTRDTAGVITALNERIQDMRDGSIQGSEDQIRGLQREIAHWREVGQALSGIQQAEADAADAAKRANEERAAAIKVAQDLAKAEASLLQTAVEARQRELSEAQRSGQATLEQRIAVIDAQMALEAKRYADAVQKIRDEQQIAEDEGKATAATRGAAIREIEALDAAHLEAVRKHEAAKADAAEESERRRMQYAADRIAAAQQATADEIALLEARLKAGEKVEADLVDAHAKAQALILQAEQSRHAQSMSDLKKLGGDQMSVQAEVARHAESMAHIVAQARLRELQAAQQVHDAILALSADETLKRRAEIEKQADAFRAAGATEIQVAEYVAAAKAAADREARQKQAEGTRALSDLRQSAMDDELRALQDRAEKGEDVTQAEADLVRRRHAMERDEIRGTLEDDVKRYGSRATAEEAMRLRLESDARAERRDLDEIAAARNKYLAEHAAKLDEIAAKKQAAFGTGPYSIEEFFKRQGIEQLAPAAPAAPAPVSLTPSTAAPTATAATPSTAASSTSAPAAGTVINVYMGNGRQSGLSGITESAITAAGDSILRDLRFGR